MKKLAEKLNPTETAQHVEPHQEFYVINLKKILTKYGIHNEALIAELTALHDDCK